MWCYSHLDETWWDIENTDTRRWNFTHTHNDKQSSNSTMSVDLSSNYSFGCWSYVISAIGWHLMSMKMHSNQLCGWMTFEVIALHMFLMIRVCVRSMTNQGKPVETTSSAELSIEDSPHNRTNTNESNVHYEMLRKRNNNWVPPPPSPLPLGYLFPYLHTHTHTTQATER